MAQGSRAVNEIYKPCGGVRPGLGGGGGFDGSGGVDLVAPAVEACGCFGGGGSGGSGGATWAGQWRLSSCPYG